MKGLAATTLAALVAFTAPASATSYLTTIARQDDRGVIELGTVRTERGGVVEIYEGDRLLGRATVHPGANDDVRVPAEVRTLRHARAVLRSGEDVLDVMRFRVDQD